MSSVKNQLDAPRWIGVSPKNYFKVTIDIVANNRIGLLADISAILAEIRIPMHEASARELKNGNANIMVTISIAGVEQLNGVMNRIKKISSVISVDRTGK